MHQVQAFRVRCFLVRCASRRRLGALGGGRRVRRAPFVPRRRPPRRPLTHTFPRRLLRAGDRLPRQLHKSFGAWSYASSILAPQALSSSALRDRSRQPVVIEGRARAADQEEVKAAERDRLPLLRDHVPDGRLCMHAEMQVCEVNSTLDRAHFPGSRQTVTNLIFYLFSLLSLLLSCSRPADLGAQRIEEVDLFRARIGPTIPRSADA